MLTQVTPLNCPDLLIHVFPVGGPFLISLPGANNEQQPPHLSTAPPPHRSTTAAPSDFSAVSSSDVTTAALSHHPIQLRSPLNRSSLADPPPQARMPASTSMVAGRYYSSSSQSRPGSRQRPVIGEPPREAACFKLVRPPQLA
jgi:hypothetical protein